MTLVKPTRPISDFLQTQFGNTKIQVLFQDTNERYVYITTEQGIGLELARVCFEPAFSILYPEVFTLVSSGGFIGKTFRTKKIPFYRDTQKEYISAVSRDISEAFNNTRNATVVEVDIYAGMSRTHIATITEIYSSIVQWPGRQNKGELDPILVATLNRHLRTLNNHSHGPAG